MPTKLHISSFIGLTIVAWLVALWIQGTPILTADFIRPFSIVVSAITIVVTLFNKYAWSWKIFQGWYVNRPDIRGTWKVELSSNWIDSDTNRETTRIIGYAVIRQTLTSLSLRLITKESHSKLIVHSIEREEDGLFRLLAVYRNEPKIELQGKRSEIHYGSMLLNIYGNPPTSLDGHYWTDRVTRGSIKLQERHKKVFDTFEQAKREFEK